MTGGARIALGVAVGYLLGRSKKMRLALMLAAAGASGRLGGTPGELLQRGTKALASSPEVGKVVDNLRGELVDALRAAAVTAASSRIDALSDRLQERATGKPAEAADELRRRVRGRPDEEEPEGAGEEMAAEGEEGEEEEEEREPAPRQRRAPAEERPRRAPRDESEEDERAGRRRAVGAGSGRAPIRRTRR
jgi:hypothetical protein